MASEALVITTGGAFASINKSKAASVTGEGQTSLSVTVPASTTNEELAIVLTVAGISGLLISSSAAVTIKTNSTGSPGNTLNILANDPLVWKSGWYYTCPLTTNVTKFYVTNASSTDAADLNVVVIYDATP